MEFEYKGYDVVISQDDTYDSPRDWDNLGIMVCFHGRYDLGDKTDLRATQFQGWEELRKHLIKVEKAIVTLPIYMYDHSGITIRTTPFGCPWDSGQIGYIYTTLDRVRDQLGWQKTSAQRRQKLYDYLIEEVKTYDQFLTGDVWGYDITKDGEHIDGCNGFYGQDTAVREAKSIIDNLTLQS